MFKKIKSLFGEDESKPEVHADAASSVGLRLEKMEGFSGAPELVTINPKAAQIEETIRGMDWQELSFVFLKQANGDEIEGSGGIEDGFSGRYAENGVEYLTRYGLVSLEQMNDLLQSYAAGDDRWRTMVEWNHLQG